MMVQPPQTHSYGKYDDLEIYPLYHFNFNGSVEHTQQHILQRR